MKDITQAPVLYIQLTDKCNLHCSYCYNNERPKNTNEPELGNIIDAIDKVNPGKIIFTGGEPLLYPKLISDTIAYYESSLSRHWNATICTNLCLDSMMTDEVKDALNAVDYIQTTYNLENFFTVKNGEITPTSTYDTFRHNVKYVKSLDNIKSVDCTVTLTEKYLDTWDANGTYIIMEFFGFDSYTVEFMSNYGYLKDPEEYYKNADEFLLQSIIMNEAAKETKTYVKLNNIDSIMDSIKTKIPVYCYLCADSNTKYFHAPLNALKDGCPCSLDIPFNKKEKFAKKCIDCEMFRYCRMGCERFTTACAFPFKSFKYLLDETKIHSK